VPKVVQLQLEMNTGDPIKVASSPIVVCIVAHVLSIPRKKSGVVPGGDGLPILCANYANFSRLGYEGTPKDNQ
jgi:hypothetical protein